MDPTITLRDAIEALRRGDHDKADELLSALKGWLDTGGYSPKLDQATSYDLTMALIRLLGWQSGTFGGGK